MIMEVVRVVPTAEFGELGILLHLRKSNSHENSIWQFLFLQILVTAVDHDVGDGLTKLCDVRHSVPSISLLLAKFNIRALKNNFMMLRLR